MKSKLILVGAVIALLVSLSVGVVVILSEGRPWFEGRELNLRSGSTGDVRVDGGVVFALGDQSGSEFVLVEEFTSDLKPGRVAKIPVLMRHWSESPKRPNLLLRSGEYRVFYGEGFDKLPAGDRGLVVLDKNFFYGFAPTGTVEEMAETRGRLVVEVVDATGVAGRNLFWFSPVDRTFEQLPVVAVGQNVRSLVPTIDGGFFALIEVDAKFAWYRFRAGRWVDTGQTNVGLSGKLFAEWSGDRGTVLLSDGSNGDIRRVLGERWTNHYSRPVSARSSNGRIVDGRIVLAEIAGRYITMDSSFELVEVANGKPE